METRASYIAVGAFFLLLLLGGIVFALWASKYSSSTVMVNHYLRVDGSVAGLNTGSPSAVRGHSHRQGDEGS